MLVFGERGKPEYPRKNLLVQSREPTNKLNPLESRVSTRVSSRLWRQKSRKSTHAHAKLGIHARGGEGSGAILSAGVFFSLFFPSAKSKVTRGSYVTRHLSMRTTLNSFVLNLNVHLISNLLFFAEIRKHTVHIHEAFLVVVLSPRFSYLSWHLIGVGDITRYLSHIPRGNHAAFFSHCNESCNFLIQVFQVWQKNCWSKLMTLPNFLNLLFKESTIIEYWCIRCLRRDSKRESRRKTTAQPSNDESDTHSDKQEIMDNTKDNYDELLKRLEKPARGVSLSKTSSKISNTDLRSSDQRDRQREEKNAGILDKPDGRVVAPSQEGSSLLFGDGTAKAKNKRRLNSSMGGPVVSSGLVAVRKDARTRHSTGRVNDGFSSKRVGSLLDYEEGPKKEEVDIQSKNQEKVDHNVRKKRLLFCYEAGRRRRNSGSPIVTIFLTVLV